MSPEQLAEAGRILWGRRIWHVKLSLRMPGLRPHHIAAMQAGEMPIPAEVEHFVVESIRKRAASCIELLRDVGASL